jgi:hypothetical protein
MERKQNIEEIFENAKEPHPNHKVSGDQLPQILFG